MTQSDSSPTSRKSQAAEESLMDSIAKLISSNPNGPVSSVMKAMDFQRMGPSANHVQSLASLATEHRPTVVLRKRLS